MGWPKGKPRKTRMISQALVINGKPELVVEPLSDHFIEAEEQPVPKGWIKGQLLNVRNGGDAYIITLFPEEYDPRYPERSMRFTNPGEAQNFISKWYTQEHHDPRAR